MDTPLSVLGTPMLIVEYSLSSVSLKYPMLPLASLPHICCTTDTAWVELKERWEKEEGGMQLV